MKTTDIFRKVAQFLWENGYNGRIIFDFKSYDNPQDIPHIRTLTGKRLPVDSVTMSRDGSRMVVTAIRKDNLPERITVRNRFGSILRLRGIHTLLQDIYYETDESWEVGDFESDFLKKP